MEVRTKVNLLCSHRAGENLIKAKKRIGNSHAVTFYHSEHREYSLISYHFSYRFNQFINGRIGALFSQCGREAHEEL